MIVLMDSFLPDPPQLSRRRRRRKKKKGPRFHVDYHKSGASAGTVGPCVCSGRRHVGGQVSRRSSLLLRVLKMKSITYFLFNSHIFVICTVECCQMLLPVCCHCSSRLKIPIKLRYFTIYFGPPHLDFFI